jgi:hypothetical protein
MLGRSAGRDVQRTIVFARALFAGRAGDAPHQTIMVRGVGVMATCSIKGREIFPVSA